jgi:uncharacterized cupredoxin-like copper-binding protein
MPRILLNVLVAAALTGLAAANAHGPERHAPAGPNLDMVKTAFGQTGDPKQVNRTLRVDMSDAMRFTPEQITVRKGETVRFLVRNGGKVMHEFVLGTDEELSKHAEMMKKFPGMAHEDPYMAHVAPGESGEVVWQFTEVGDFKFGCLLPGHFEAGMVGRIRVVAR